ncbi:hypothetical protein V2H45_14925 [Tumidithrix elongata RA019]|uniref:Uncharacterized protein n=1 Tax=Tumidithrix elongata BACA0141 TaxID=2716417 RepID=A0AAW9PUU2_9CYAN|nr:hypothetical protein [Tumidithrix elongata RA019]
MPFTEITLDDLMILEQFRIERLRSFFAESLLSCIIQIDRHSMLTIHCPKPWIVDTLLMEIEDLCDYTWLILGVESLSLYLVHEEIFHIGNYRAGSANCKLCQRI